ncbi:MAG: NADH-quinone oxidoreductase subunit M [Ignavibacteriales bacterium]|nr:MAG: NADH-quinone oxidoreductase subunit M [Ignavibacteriaceae bacterium]MBW7872505.1 NADH-quinone oxidoreductase subunit M [Ignavibacteria bacterium]MCZ2141942.1 NADH-quinone oxidoreductase subunit M [Ignavibacteriales bacterium]MBV6445108.1 NADH-quinone oxidoreductase subunit M [Ignavibacteriaceae bacterium]MBZ0197627.1 NADH-quinone oxidoreductase subunit M [Ignavibacteriaceae bacterium]
MENNFILSLLLILSVGGSLLILLLPRENGSLLRVTGLVISLVIFLVSLFAWYNFDPRNPGFQFVEKASWIKGLGISYFVGIDGMSLLLVLLTTFITPLALLSTWKSIEHKVKEFTFFMLLLEAGMLGVFMSLDLFLFYIFWEAMLIPMYFIIGVWGGKNRIYASVKFFIYTMTGSLVMLVAIIWLANSGKEFTTDLTELYKLGPTLGLSAQNYLFAAFVLSFAIKVPVFPLHTWLPDAHVEAPTAGSVILAGVLLKMGTYGMVRFNLPLFPDATKVFAPYLAILAVIGIIYGSLVSMVQKDMKKLVAYSSVAHLGFVVLGIFGLTTESIQGAIIQMVNHGLSTGALFLLVGYLYERTHTRVIAEYGGIAKLVPVYATILLFISLSSIGLPGLNGFIGEFLILVGSFSSPVLNNPLYAIIAALGVILAAVYLLWWYQRMCLETVKNEKLNTLTDLNTRELFTLIPIMIVIVWIGIYPSTFLRLSEAFSSNLVSSITNALAK